MVLYFWWYFFLLFNRSPSFQQSKLYISFVTFLFVQAYFLKGNSDFDNYFSVGHFVCSCITNITRFHKWYVYIFDRFLFSLDFKWCNYRKIRKYSVLLKYTVLLCTFKIVVYHIHFFLQRNVQNFNTWLSAPRQNMLFIRINGI